MYMYTKLLYSFNKDYYTIVLKNCAFCNFTNDYPSKKKSNEFL